MKQIFHIFKKDLRSYWMETAISLALVAALGWCGPQMWLVHVESETSGTAGVMKAITGILLFLLTLSWALLIARSVHGEPLVGDRQFWITRPVAWRQLLLAKLLSIAVFILLPFFLLQILLLLRAGFSPLPWIPTLLASAALLFACALLPLIALATLTKSLGRFVLLCLGALLYFILLVMAFLSLSSKLQQTHGPAEKLVTALLVLLLCCTAIRLQYRRSNYALAFVMMLLVPVVSLGLPLLSPDRYLMDRYYPRASSQPVPVQLRFDAQDQVHSKHWSTELFDQPRFELPVQLSGVASDRAVNFDQARYTLVNERGERWESSWQSIEDRFNTPTRDLTRWNFAIPQKVLDRFGNNPVTVYLTLAVTELQKGKVETISLPGPMQEFSVPGFGTCTMRAGSDGEAHGIVCRSPTETPETHINTTAWDQPCSQTEPAIGAETVSTEVATWTGNNDQPALPFTFFPVTKPMTEFERMVVTDNDDNIRKVRRLCAGTPMIFSRYSVVRRTQVDTAIPNFPLASYVEKKADLSLGRNKR